RLRLIAPTEVEGEATPIRSPNVAPAESQAVSTSTARQGPRAGAGLDEELSRSFEATFTEEVTPLRVRANAPQQRTPVRTAPPSQGVRESTGAAVRGPEFQSASARTARSVGTAIRPDVGESEAYKEALTRNEVGLQRPTGANVPGADFITAAEE